MLHKRRTIAFAVAIAGALLISAAACGDNRDGEEINEIRAQLDSIQGTLDQLQTMQTSLDEIGRSLSKTEVVAAMSFLDGVGFHDIDEELQTASALPASLSSRITRARQVAEGTDWPEPLREHAEELIAALRSFEAALDEENLAQSKGLASEAHDRFHDLEGVAYPFLAGEEPEGQRAEGGDGDDHTEDEQHADEQGDNHD